MPPHRLIIFIPQTDQAAASWLKLFEKHPPLRLVIAVSPRFQRLTQDPALKAKVQELQKAGRLELALQLPNPPFLPLLINTDAAKSALPPGSPVPHPPFAYPNDAQQIVAKAKSEFTRAWGHTPKGLVLPLGAVNADVLKLVNHLGFSWVVGALGGSPGEGAYRYAGLQAWDATPTSKGEEVLVWDERVYGNPDQSLRTLNTWVQDHAKKGIKHILPSDPGVPVRDLPAAWGGRTWTTSDWSPWIGSSAKNAAWSWLRRTREALEKFKNSGQASVRRLDMAFEELHNAENANYFSGMTEGESTFTLAEEREREFKATLSSVFRLIGQSPPDNLFDAEAISPQGYQASSTTFTWETHPDGRGHLTIVDPSNDADGDGRLVDPSGDSAVPGRYDLQRLEVRVTPETLDWTVTLGALIGSTLGNFENTGPLIDLYVDVNGQPNVGTVSFFRGRGAAARPTDAWEYGFSLWGTQAHFYRTRGAEAYDLAESVPLVIEANRVRFSVPRTWLRGNPRRWGYQALVMAYDPQSLENDVRPLVLPDMTAARRLPIYDLIDPLDIPQGPLLLGLEEGTRSGVPFLRASK